MCSCGEVSCIGPLGNKIKGGFYYGTKDNRPKKCPVFFIMAIIYLFILYSHHASFLARISCKVVLSLLFFDNLSYTLSKEEKRNGVFWDCK